MLKSNKRIVVYLLAISMLFTMAACGTTTDSSGAEAVSAGVQSVPEVFSDTEPEQTASVQEASTEDLTQVETGRNLYRGCFRSGQRCDLPDQGGGRDADFLVSL